MALSFDYSMKKKKNGSTQVIFYSFWGGNLINIQDICQEEEKLTFQTCWSTIYHFYKDLVFCFCFKKGFLVNSKDGFKKHQLISSIEQKKRKKKKEIVIERKEKIWE